MSARKYSTVGRPRVLTEEQVNQILQWHEALNRWKTLRGELKTYRQLAKELGVTTGGIWWVIKCRGEFKRPARLVEAASIRSRLILVDEPPATG